MPAAHVSDQENKAGVGRPFTKDPLVVYKMKSKIFVAGGKVGQVHFTPGKTVFCLTDF